MLLALFMGHLHAELLYCFLHAVYFSIYSSIVLLRQCPTFSGCFFSPPHSIAFCSDNTSPFTAFIWNALEHKFRLFAANSCCVRIDKNVILLWCEGELAQMLVKKSIVRLSENARFNHCSEHYFAYFSHPRSYLQSKHLRRPCFQGSILVRQWSMTSLLPVKSLYSECLFKPEFD